MWLGNRWSCKLSNVCFRRVPAWATPKSRRTWSKVSDDVVGPFAKERASSRWASITHTNCTNIWRSETLNIPPGLWCSLGIRHTSSSWRKAPDGYTLVLRFAFSYHSFDQSDGFVSFEFRKHCGKPSHWLHSTNWMPGRPMEITKNEYQKRLRLLLRV